MSVDSVHYSTPANYSTSSVNHSMPANSSHSSHSLQDVTDAKNTADTPTWVIPTIIGVGGALVASLVYVCCRIIYQKD